MAPFSLAERLANAVVAYSAYVVKLLIPVNLAVFYPHPGMPAPGRLIAAALGCAALSVVAIRAARTCRWGLMGWLWFIGMLVPVIGVVQVGSQAMADRYSYLPAIGIFVIVAWAAGAAARNARARPAIIAASVCVIAAAALGARRQVGYWQNSRTLMRRAAAVTECNFLAYNNIGVTFFDERRYDSALTYFHRALRCDSTFSPALYNTGITLARTRRYADALDWFHKTIRFDSTHAQAYHSIGETHDALGRDSLARVWYERALMIQSDLWEAHNSLAVWFQHHGEPDSAVIHFRAAIALRPGNAAAHHGLALSLWKRGDVGGAEYHFAQALSLDSTSWRACNNFGLFLVDLNRRRAALAAFDNAAALAPDSARPYVNRAMLHAALGDTGRAVADYARALRIDSTLPIARERLNRIRAAKSSHLAGRHDNEQ
jgi:Tfp pilus assembly protein PilF